jgi:hypothetical protein
MRRNVSAIDKVCVSDIPMLNMNFSSCSKRTLLKPYFSVLIISLLSKGLPCSQNIGSQPSLFRLRTFR